MKDFIKYIEQFAPLNAQQIEIIESKGTEIELKKEGYFIEERKVLKHVGFVFECIFRIYYFNQKGEEITKIFIEENHLLYNLKNIPSKEYIQAITNCKLLVFSNRDWEEISDII